MQIVPIKTHTITEKDKDILKIIDQYVIASKGTFMSTERTKVKQSLLPNRSVLVVTSKIISITQGRMVKMDNVDKDKLIQQESQYYLPRNKNKYQVSLTIAQNSLVATAGIDESNANGSYILWPENPQEVANKIREHMANLPAGRQGTGLKNFGVIITDSKTSPLRWGVTAMAIAYSGFAPLKDYVGKPDLFGRSFVFEKLNIADSLAAAAGVVMGEGAEQTPMALITDLSNVEFVNRNPTQQELDNLIIKKEDDLYGPLLTSVEWKKGLR